LTIVGETTPTIADVIAMLERQSPTEVEKQLLAIRAEERSLKLLLRTLRARETACKRREDHENG
jgi:hypothetical protein